MVIRTTYVDSWQPPGRPPGGGGRRNIPRGTGGGDSGGSSNLIGTIFVLVTPLGQITAGQEVRFTAVRSGGSAPLTYQWSGPSGVIPGATSNIYTFTTTSPSDSGTYTCTVTSAGATDTPKSAGATITVALPPGANPIQSENALTGVADSTVGYATIGSGTNGFYGYSKQFSRNVGQAINFAVDGTGATNIAIHRIGHYGGLRWRLITTIANTGTNQPDTQVLASSAGSRSAANWSTTATWNIPADAVSGLYVAVVRNSSNVAQSWIPFIVREDGRAADIVIRVSDTTWGAAYNTFGTKAAPLDGKSVYGEGKGASIFDLNLRGVQMSYDRPIVTRGSTAGGSVVNHWDVHESALIDWIEKNGYNVKYISCYDLDQGLSAVGSAKVLACAGHDEYWSDGMVNNTEAFIAAGGHHVSMSANSQFWRIRWADGGRTFWCYKDTMQGPTALPGSAGTPQDPVSWTGTWRDTRWPQRRPENLLLGATFRMNGIRDETMVINGTTNQAKPFWRNTTVAAGTNLTVAQVIGFEADSLDFPNSGGVNLGATTININGSYADDNGQTYANNGTLNWGIACHYPRPQAVSGLSVHFSTNQWMWGLSNYHRRGSAVINREMRQATYNLLTDLGAVAATKESDLTTVAPVALSTYGATRVDRVSVAVAPGSVLEDSAPNLVFTFTRFNTVGALTVNYTIGGTATNGTDYATIGASVVIANGSTTATVTVNPTTDATFEADETVILTVAVGTGYAAVSPSSATGTITNDDAAPPSVEGYQLVAPDVIVDSATVDISSYQLGQEFTVTANAWVTAVKFYRPVANANSAGLNARTWVVKLWQNAQPIGSGTVATVLNETGWITATLESPIAVVPGVTYTASYHIPANTGYATLSSYLTSGLAPGGANPLVAVAASGKFSNSDPHQVPNTSFNNGFYLITPVVVTAAPVGVLNNMWTVPSGLFLGAPQVEGPYELGMRYTVTAAQSLVAVRFFRSATDSAGSNTVRVWDAGGTQLASATTSTAVDGGYITVPLSSAVALSAGQTFTVSVNNYTSLQLNDTGNDNRTVPLGTVVGSRINAGGSGVHPTSANDNDFYVQPIFA
jgi:hypothetical protein